MFFKKRRLGGDVISGFGFLMGEYREDRAYSSQRCTMIDRMKDNTNLQQKKFQLDIRKKDSP